MECRSRRFFIMPQVRNRSWHRRGCRRFWAAWADAVGKQNLKETNLPEDVAKPFEFVREDVSQAQQRTAAMWSKLLPFVLLLWALTGAFYPAIDLCAGEKERGTLETLLVQSGAAERDCDGQAADGDVV